MPYYYINNDFCKTQGIKSDLDGLIINYFYKLVDNDKDWVIAVSFSICQNWQIYDKIYRYFFLAIGKNRQGL